MKNRNFTKLWMLLGFCIGLFAFNQTNLKAQTDCPNSGVTVDANYTAGGFAFENGWELVNTSTGEIEFFEPTGGTAPATTTISLPEGSYELFGYDDFLGWEGGMLEFVQAGSVLCSTSGPTATTSANTNVCGDPVSGGGVLLCSFEVAAPTCAITCPDDIVVENDPGQCGAFVEVPQPEVSGSCVSTCSVFETQSTPVTEYIFTGGGLDNTPTTLSNAATAACGPVVMTATFTGDHSGFEHFDIEFPDGSTTGNIWDDAGQCDQEEVTFDIPVSDWNTWVADFGPDLTFTLLADSDVSGPALCDIDEYQLSFDIGTASVPFVNDFTGSEDASGFYPVGTTTVTWTTTDPSGLPVECTMDITVEDVEPPTAICPSDQTINLEPGACDADYSFVVEGEDNCPTISQTVAGPFCNPCEDPSGGSALACFTFNENSVIQFVDLPSAGFVEYFTFNQETFGDEPIATINIYEGTASGPVPYTGGGFTPIFSIDYVSDAADDGSCVQVDFGTQVPVDGGVWVEVFTPGNTANSRIVQTPESCDGNDATGEMTYFVYPACGNPTPSTAADLGFIVDASYALGFVAPLTATPTDEPGFNEFESGDKLPIGTHCFQYEVSDAAGNSSSCEWCVTVEEFPDPIKQLACNDNVNVSVNPNNCEALITPDMILEGGPYGCYDDYIVEIFDENGNPVPNPVTGAFIGEQLEVHITDPDGTVPNNTCWGYLTVEDKTIPPLQCSSTSLPCDADLTPGTGQSGIPAVLFASEDTTELEDVTAVACPGGDYQYLRVIDLQELGISGTFIPDRFRMGVETSNGGVDVTLRFYTFDDPSSYDPTAMGFSYDDITQVGDENTGTIPALDLEFWEMPVDGVTIPAGTQYVVYELMAPGSGGFGGDFIMGSNTLGETLPTYLASDFCVPADPTRIDQHPDGPFDGNWVSMVYGTTTTEIPFPVPDSAIVTPDSGPGPFIVSNFDACGDVTLTFEDEEVSNDDICDGDFLKTIFRTWTAVDESGNTRTCQDTFNIQRQSIDEIEAPPNFDGIEEDPLSCVDGYPDTSVTGTPGLGCENIVSGFEDLVIDVCPGSFKVLRNFTVLDWCTSETTEFTQIIKVIDETGPVITCPPDMTISTGNESCTATLSVPVPEDIIDECSDETSYEITSSAGDVTNFGGNSYVITELPIGEHTVTYTANDGCGNTSSCEMSVTVEDRAAPVARCDEFTRVSLGTDGKAKVFVSSLNDGSTDNCGIDRIKVRRKTEGSCPIGTIDDDDIWRDYVEFCCNDIAVSPIEIQLAVWDESGNSNICWVNVEVEDKLPPFVTCPPDLTVSCDYPFDLWNLDVFGKVVPIPAEAEVVGFLPGLPNPDYPNPQPFPNYPDTTIVFNEKDRNYYFNDFGTWVNYNYKYEGTEHEAPDSIIISDPTFVEECQGGIYTGPEFVGWDGYAADNCDLTVSESYVTDLECGNGSITRIFTATDAGGMTSTCIQNVFVEDCDPFFINPTNPNDPNDDVQWPSDQFLTNQCMNAETDPENTGEPIVDDDNCSQVAITYEDEVFEVQDEACFKILRHWTVIDWCQFEEETGEGRWEFTQTIRVDNTNPPMFDPCQDMTFCDTLATQCKGFADLAAPVTDDCTDFEDLEGSYRIYLNEEGANEPASCDNSVDLNVEINDITSVVSIERSGIINSPVFSDNIYYSEDNGSTWQVYPPPLPQQPLTVTDRENFIVRRTVQYADDCAPDTTYLGTSLDASWYYAYGTHRVFFTAEDQCGNTETCKFNFTVEDCKKPTPVCINGISTAVMPENGELNLWAKDFDASSFDNCTDNEDLLFSFTGDEYQPNQLYTCDSLEDGIKETFQVEIWVADEGKDENDNGQIEWSERNKNFCTTYVIIEDNNDVCEDDTTGIDTSTIAGTILTEGGEPVSDAAITGESVQGYTDADMTNNQGEYRISGVPEGHDVNVSAARDDDPLNGVSTYDLVLIQKHILGINELNTPYKLVAANVNDDENISAIDLVELRKLILGIYDEFQSNESWRFAARTLPAGTVKLPSDMENNTITDFTEPVLDADFTGIKIGDVSGDVRSNGLQDIEERDYPTSLRFQTGDRRIGAGEEVRVEITSDNFEEVLGYQFTLDYQTDLLEYTGVESGAIQIDAGNFGLTETDKGYITTSWNRGTPLTVSEGEVLFTLVFAAEAAGQLSEALAVSSQITSAESYTSTEQKGVAFRFGTKGEATATEFALYQNTPNPFETSTVIGFTLPQAGDATLTIYDVTGKVVTEVRGTYDAGYNQVEIDRSEVSSGGVMYYQLDADDHTATKKMVVIQ